MPLYEYQCHSCGKKFEVIQKFSDEPLTKHEECGGEVEQLISAPAFHFKGSGWYVTDYAKGNGGAPKSDGGKTDADAKAGGESENQRVEDRLAKSADSKPPNRTTSKPAETKASSSPAPESK